MAQRRPSTSESVREYARGAAGGLLFSLPLLYTMEVWQHGVLASPQRLLLGLVATYGLLCLYNAFAGLRENHDTREIFVDSVEELGIGLLLSAGVLFMLGRIGPHSTFPEALGLIVAQACTTSIGVSVGTAQLGESNEDKKPPRLLGQVAISLCGAVLIAANVAPTEEILLLGVEATPLQLLAMLVVSALLSLIVLELAEVRGHRDFDCDLSLPRIVVGPIVTVAVALAASAALLFWYGRLQGDGMGAALAQIVTLAVPTTLGASAGRALLQS